jgi:hypothetical protein
MTRPATVTPYNAQGQKVSTGSAATVAYLVNNSNARFIVAGSGALANSGRNNPPCTPPTRSTGARNDLVPSDPLFGRFDQFYSSNSRVVQLNAKFTFGSSQ